MNKKRGGWILAGLLMIAVSVGIFACNLQEAKVAGKYAQTAAEGLIGDISVNSQAYESGGEISYPDYILNPDMDMPVNEEDGYSYIGIIEIPSLELELPIQSKWSYPNMKVSPCRYEGSAYLDDLVICGHNYSTHFGTLKELSEGESIRFTDMDGNIFSYQVKKTEILAPDAVSDMTSGDWNLTLFTCTPGGTSRVAVRCDRTDI